MVKRSVFYYHNDLLPLHQTKTMNDVFDYSVRYFHFLAIFAMFALLTCEHLLLKGRLPAQIMQKLAIIDVAYGMSAIVVLLCGLSLWFLVGKPPGFYNHNWILHAKVGLFVLVGLISIIPTIFILKHRKTNTDVDVPKHIVMCIRIELLLLCIIPLLAVLMANGVGYTH